MANPFGDTLMRGVEGMFEAPAFPNTSNTGGTATGTQPTQPSNSGIDALLGLLQQSQQRDPLADLSSVLGGFSSGEKANRVVEGNFQGDYDRLMVDRENLMNTMGLRAQADRNANETDAWKKLQQTAYVSGGGSNYGPMSIMLGGQQRQLPMFPGIAPVKPSGAEMEGARSLQGQLMGRLQPGGSFEPQWNYMPRDVSEYAKPGIMEQIGSYGGAITGGISAIDRLLGGKDGKGPISGAISSGLGKLGGLLGFGGGAAAPIVGGAGSAIPGSIAATSALPGAIASQGASAGVYGAGSTVAGAGAGGGIGSMLAAAAPYAAFAAPFIAAYLGGAFEPSGYQRISKARELLTRGVPVEKWPSWVLDDPEVKRRVLEGRAFDPYGMMAFGGKLGLGDDAGKQRQSLIS